MSPKDFALLPCSGMTDRCPLARAVISGELVWARRLQTKVVHDTDKCSACGKLIHECKCTNANAKCRTQNRSGRSWFF